MSSYRLLLAVPIAAAVLSAPAALGGQVPVPQHEPSLFERRASGSIDALVIQPTGALHDNIDTGIGIGFAGLFRLSDSGAVSLRADLGLGGYGEESKRVPLSPTVGGRIQVDVTTRNYVAVGSFGPQLTLPYGPVRPYVNGGVAFQVFFTESAVEGADDSYEFANTTNQSDWTPAFTLGGGLYVPLRTAKVPVLLDLGFTWYTGGHASYLKPGSIEDLPNAQIRITPLESATPFVLMRLGVKIGL
jgi:hypothetical protein